MTVYPVQLRVHIKDKNSVKAAGGKWNATTRAWEVRNPATLYKCRKWAPPGQRLGLLWSKEWLDVPYLLKDRAKAAGARFDKAQSCWYAPLGSATLSEELNPYRMRWRVGPVVR
jgi:putative DNA primase/helicase